MTSLKNDRLLRAIYQQPLDRTPVWIMRQAGRYLPEYRKTRQQAGSFKALCQNPELAAEVTLQPLRRFALDAAIIFSDILTIPDALGLPFQMQEGRGPYFEQPIRGAEDLQCLTQFDCDQLHYVYQAIQLVKSKLANEIPLIGFCGSPWTLAAYMVQGRSETNFPALFALKETAPEVLQTLLSTLAEACYQHLAAQIRAGCDVVMIFDTWGGLLAPQDYETYSLSAIKSIINKLEKNDYTYRKVPLILFSRDNNSFIEQLAASGCDVLGVDWQISLNEARMRTKDKVALQGNLNPSLLLADDNKLRQAVEAIIHSFGKGNGHIFNLGHGITPDVPPEKVSVLIETIHKFSPSYKLNG